MRRVRVIITGVVQGVGFRPFVYREALRLGLTGSVLNDRRGVTVEVQGGSDSLDVFVETLRTGYPPLATVDDFSLQELALQPREDAFRILHSDGSQEPSPTAAVPPDTALCPACLDELRDPADRRYRYPFINCTDCGPRYSIIRAIPYDRPHTTMADFPLCVACRQEYEDPASRRFHAQPNACPDCGPQLSLLADGELLAGEAALGEAIRRLKVGEVVAVKGIGGFHLAVDATSDRAVALLRRRKERDEKAFALMVPDLGAARNLAQVSEREARLLASVERPIVLLHVRPDAPVSAGVAPHNRYLGIMLPYAPLHHLLLESFGALVMTSANLSDEPILYRDEAAEALLGSLADAVLTHDRPIHARVDDSIARVADGRPLLLRRARGYAPRALRLPFEGPPVLAVGAELKGAVCLTRGERAYLGPHIGDLKAGEMDRSFGEMVEHLKGLFEVTPEVVAHDLHPDFVSTAYARKAGLPTVAVQHHHAHLAACMVEHGLEAEVIGILFDGTGLGEDGRLWGGECLVGGYGGFRRIAHLKPMRLPGGEAAIREPFRLAAALLVSVFGDDLPELPPLAELQGAERSLLLHMIRKGINAPESSSVGRLFDAVSSLAGVRQRIAYEGQAALELEMALDRPLSEVVAYPFELSAEGPWVADPAPLVRALVDDLEKGRTLSEISARFHEGVAQLVLALCRLARRKGGEGRVVLSGGCFQNVALLERSAELLRVDGFSVHTPQLVPPNDGGIALGQAAIAAWRQRRGR